MNKRPLISIGLCTYNGAAFLREQLESLVRQTYRPLEIRIRDDRSVDTTLEIIREFQSRYPFIHLVENQERLGLQKNFEAVFMDCTGDFIAPSDQDDVWKPEKLERLYQSIHSHQLVYHDSELIDEMGNSLNFRISDKFQLGQWKDQIPFLLFNCISGHSMLFRKNLRELAIPIPEAGFYDHWLAWVALESGTVGYCPEVLVSYRQHQSNQTDLLGKKEGLSGLERAISRISRENSWLETCAKFKEEKTPVPSIVRFKNLAKKRESSFFNFDLGWEIWKNRALILQITPLSPVAKLAFAFRYSMGLKAKKLFYTIR